MKLKHIKTFFGIVSVLCVSIASQAEVVNLSNGDRITGKLLRTMDTGVVLETEFGVITIPRNSVIGVSNDVSESNLQTSLTAKKADAEIAKNGDASKKADEEKVVDETAPEAKAKTPEWIQDYRNFIAENFPEGWQFRLRGGLELRETSSTVFSIYSSFDVIRQWELDKLSATAYYNYTEQTSIGGVTDTTIDKYGIDTSFRHDFDKSSHWYLQNILNYKKDTVKGIKDQVDEAVTLGYRFDIKRYNLVIDVAPGPAVRYINANNYDNKWVAMAVLSEDLTWYISNLLRFEQNGYIGMNLTNTSQYSASLKLAFIIQATDVMDIALRYAYSYDSINASTAQRSEQTLLLSFEFPFNWGK